MFVRKRLLMGGCGSLQPWTRLLRQQQWRGKSFQLALRRYQTSSSSSFSSSWADDKKKLVLLVIPVTTFCLGTWQIFRLQWKLDLIDDLERRTTRPPIIIPTDIQDRLGELEYRRVQLHGHFDHTRELFMWPRSRNMEGAGSSQQRGSEPGAHVVTPFYCTELGEFVLVNRGWVPRKRMDPETRQQGQVEGDITLTAVVRTDEKRAPFAPHNDPSANRWSHRDVPAMAKQAETIPVLLDADATCTVPSGPIGGQTRVTLRNEHLQYVFTWYALSLITFYMFWQMMRKSKRWSFR